MYIYIWYGKSLRQKDTQPLSNPMTNLRSGLRHVPLNTPDIQACSGWTCKASQTWPAVSAFFGKSSHAFNQTGM